MNRYILGSEQMFHDFINSISKKDKIGLVTHTDLDGLTSGVVLQRILESRGLKLNFIKFLNYGSGSLKKVVNKKFDVLFFTDWNADNYPKELEKIKEKSKILVFDHHPFNEELKDKSNLIKTQSDYCTSHALFDLATHGKYFDTKSLEWLVSAAIIIDYTWDKHPANFKFIKSVYSEVKKDSSIWESEPGKTGKTIANAIIYYSPNFRKVYDLILKSDLTSLDKADKIIRKEIGIWISKFKKEAEYFPRQKLYFAYGNPKYNITSAVASRLSDEDFRESTVIFVFDMNNKKGFVKLSARNQTGDVNLGKILKECSEKFDNASGGGHVRAASATLRKRDLNKFKEIILSEIKSS